jgi:hypothetical protein
VLFLLVAQRSRRAWLYLLLAGVCAGMAPLVKQSSIDGIAAVVLFAPLERDVHLRARLGRLAVVLCGVAVPLLLSVLHGALTGWQAYINAVLLDALRYRAVEAGTIPLHRAITGFQDFWTDAAFLVVAAGFGLVSLLRRGGDGLRWLPVAWLAAALYALTLGGFYFRHYFVQLLPPLCLLAALGLVAVVRLNARWPWAALLLLLPLAGLLNAIRLDAPFYINSSPLGISARLYGWAEYAHQQELVAFLRSRVPAGQPFFVAYAAPELHYLTGRPSITPYLWRRPLGELPGGYANAVRAVARGLPVCIVVVQPLATAPGDRRMRAAIGTRYVKAWSPRGIAILCRPYAPPG